MEDGKNRSNGPDHKLPLIRADLLVGRKEEHDLAYLK